MQADHLHRGVQRGDVTHQIDRGHGVRTQVQQHHLRLKLPGPDLERLMGRITLEVRQDLKAAGLRNRLQELAREFAIGRDQQCGDFRTVL